MTLDNLDFLSSGFCPDGCEECSESHNEDGHLGYTGKSFCDGCGSAPAGLRYPAHGRDKNGELCHLEICETCFEEING